MSDDDKGAGAGGKKSGLAKTHDWLISPAGRLVRYVIVLAVVITALVGFFNQWFNLCEVVTSDKEGVTETCAGPDLSSASVLAAVFLVFLLLWPDLSEFSAFGVTLKKLVEKVDETVTETDRKVGRIEVQAAGIDRTTSSTSDTANDLRGDLREIRGTLQALAERSWSSGDGRGSGGTAGNSSRWDRQDQSNLDALCGAILGPEGLQEAVEQVREQVGGFRDDATSELLGGDTLEAFTARLVGLLVLLYRRVRTTSAARGYGEAGDSGQRADQIDRLLRLVDQLIRAYMDGRNENLQAVMTAAATLLQIDKGTR